MNMNAKTIAKIRHDIFLFLEKWSVILLVVAGASLSQAQNHKGFVQVTCEPGVTVFFDGKEHGVSTLDAGGYIIENVSEGQHALRLLKDGFFPQEDTIVVKAGKVAEYRIQPFKPRVEVNPQETNVQQIAVQTTGTLLVQSLPLQCDVVIRELGIDTRKEEDEWMKDKIPVGTYECLFKRMGKTLDSCVVINGGRKAHLFANFTTGQVAVLEEEKEKPPFEPFKIVEIGKDVKIELVWCPPGTFMMGSPDDEANRDPDEGLHRVTLTQGFWMGKTEVTQRQWESVMEANPSRSKDPDLPVEMVSWEECRTFIRKLNKKVKDGGFRLPTEAEWEYACRAGTNGLYHGTLKSVAWYVDNNGGTTHAVGQMQANAWGLFDMHGNVWEWCQDWYGNYPTNSVSDFTGPRSGTARVNRGGSWRGRDFFCRSANRGWIDPEFRGDLLGLRLAKTHVEP